MTPVGHNLAPALAGILADHGYDPDAFEITEEDIERDEARREADLARFYADQREAEIVARGFNAKHATLIAGRMRRKLLEGALAKFEKLALRDAEAAAVELLEREIKGVVEATVIPLAECWPRVSEYDRKAGRRVLVPWSRDREKGEQRFDRVSYHYHRARRAVRDGRKLVVLCGAKGIGKSWIEAMLAAEFGGRAVKSTHLLSDGLWLRGGERSSVTGLTRHDVICGATPLWIDDFGQEAENRVSQTIDGLNEIAPARVDMGRFLGLTMNLLGPGQVAHLLPRARNAEEAEAIRGSGLAAWMGTRWALFNARLQEHGALIECDGPNLRVDGPDLRAVERRERWARSGLSESMVSLTNCR